MDRLNEVAAYCAAHIEDYELRAQLALKTMDRMRCPLSMADSALCSEIRDRACDWANDNDYAVDFFDEIDEEQILFAC